MLTLVCQQNLASARRAPIPWLGAMKARTIRHGSENARQGIKFSFLCFAVSSPPGLQRALGVRDCSCGVGCLPCAHSSALGKIRLKSSGSDVRTLIFTVAQALEEAEGLKLLIFFKSPRKHAHENILLGPIH